jgi:hypothetical protein
MENRQTIHSSRNAVIEAQVAAPSCKTWPLREKNDITGSIRCPTRRPDRAFVFRPSPFSIFTLESRPSLVKQKFCDAHSRDRETSRIRLRLPQYRSLSLDKHKLLTMRQSQGCGRIQPRQIAAHRYHTGVRFNLLVDMKGHHTHNRKKAGTRPAFSRCWCCGRLPIPLAAAPTARLPEPPVRLRPASRARLG